VILATHLIFCAYGFWLPNDPRGSWSEKVVAWELFQYGDTTKTSTRQSVAHRQHDWQRRLAAKSALKDPPVIFSGLQARAIGRGFARAAAESGYVVYACCILPEHVHAVIKRHEKPAVQIVGHLKSAATKRLTEERICPDSKVWARGSWQVFLENPQEVQRAVRYVQNNPIRANKAPQRWSFISLYAS